ncbi:MAG TPA: hypothetical protein VF898_02945, partial [Chloroflexota bacterium]
MQSYAGTFTVQNQMGALGKRRARTSFPVLQVRHVSGTQRLLGYVGDTLLASTPNAAVYWSPGPDGLPVGNQDLDGAAGIDRSPDRKASETCVCKYGGSLVDREGGWFMTRRKLFQRPMVRLGSAIALVMLTTAAGVAPMSRTAVPATGALAAGTCSLSSPVGPVQHVISIQFDNVHFRRDLPNVPSDLEQMPHLNSFIQNNGVMLTNHHTPLISHTSEDILTSLTGVYPNRHGVAVGQNSYQYYANGSPTPFTTAFTYWTDTIGNGTYNMLSGAPTSAKPTGTNAPAPWVPYTRAGCDVGGVATANMELENANVNSKFGANDIGNVY